MLILFISLLLFLTLGNWLFSQSLVFLPLQFFHGVESLISGLFLTIGIIILLWMFGDD